MNKHIYFTPNRQAMLLALVAAIYPAAGYSAAAGRVEFATGGVTATGVDGQARPLTKGAAVDAGDMIQTGAGRAQVRFSDGGIISLQPNTEFRIDEYHFDGRTDGSEKGFFSLVKGGLRAITGAIGHVNKKNYQVGTSVATIGIRGTEFLALLNDTLEMTCGEGICVLFNDAGELVLNAGESGRAKNRKSSPESVTEKPNLPPEQNIPNPRFEIYSSSEDRDINGNPCSITGCATANVLPSGFLSPNGFVAAFTDANGSGPSWGGFSYVDGGEGFSATFNASGQMTSLYGGTTSNWPYSPNFELGSNALTISSGNDGIIAWGRWLGNVVDGGEGATTFGPRDGWHYVVGIPTPSLPSGTASYSMIGATLASSPTLGNGTFSGALNVDFDSSQVQAQFALTFASGTANFAYSDTNGSIYGASGTYQFYGSGLSSSGSLCAAYSCSANFHGFFAGPDAARAGMAYKVDTGSDLINGTAAFTKSGTGVAVPFIN